MADPVPRTGHISHLGLFAHARALRRTAMADDIEALHAQLCSLRNAVVDHLHDEAHQLGHLSPAAQAVVTAGQRRVLDHIDTLLASSSGRTGRCHCVGHSTQLVGLLARQARLEADLLGESAPGRLDAGR